MKKIKEKIKNRFKGMTLKSYIKETADFITTNLKKSFVILLVISILIVVMGVQTSVESIQIQDNYIDIFTEKTFAQTYLENIQTVFIVIFAGIVPYMYVPVIGAIAGAFSELTTLAYLIVENGYLKAIIVYLVPMLLNICIMCVATSLGLYICKTVTLNHKVSELNHMNITNFKIKLYELTKKDKKKKRIENEKKKKIEELEKKNKKLDYLQIFNIGILLFILEIIVSIFKVIII